MQKLSILAFGAAVGILWGASIFLLSLLYAATGGTYGWDWLQLIASCYPGFAASGGVVDGLVGFGYGLLDGFVWGALLAWLYNRLVRPARA